ncbi:phospholipid/cholesterol/gamma-HCH transport system substrate-binding protein [Nocardia farcinica]|uniref:Virulence factor Mce family protein n=1 Tax=Nocardia farcinica TaxID=37329 RepID=A0A0H5P5P0_NOCFR|nr:MCE family protein [Nocardia farcinica]SLG98069.1 virulence factor Mce family protein [Mycobacteroides abscessus subsp. abscessus]AXK85851.1 MCE family protein [Nocardia farcinica]MBA4859198.1 MCE family protein [Nocardia farcinica]MBC9819020.1 MCE family protein [Nocardia farcinica]PFW98762.1 hypothetical protein CJ469_05931 [Nocardia farcinica]
MTDIRSAAVKLAVFGVLIALATVFVVSAMRTPVPGDRVGYSAKFTDVSGLHTGDTVRMSGVAVGTVEAIDLVGDQALVRFSVDRGRPLYTDTRVAVRYQDLIGRRYVEIIQADTSAERLSPDSTIPVERTVASFDVSVLFDGFKPLFDTLSTAELNQFGNNILRVLQGDGSGVRPALADLERLTEQANDSEALVVLLIRNLGVIADQIGGKSQAVGDFVEQVGGIVRRFSTTTSEILLAADRGNRALGELVPILEQVRDVYDEGYPPMDALLHRLVPQSGQLVSILGLVPSLISGLNRAVPAAGAAPTVNCSAGELPLPGIGASILAGQNLVVCR